MNCGQKKYIHEEQKMIVYFYFLFPWLFSLRSFSVLMMGFDLIGQNVNMNYFNRVVPKIDVPNN